MLANSCDVLRSPRAGGELIIIIAESYYFPCDFAATVHSNDKKVRLSHSFTHLAEFIPNVGLKQHWFGFLFKNFGKGCRRKHSAFHDVISQKYHRKIPMQENRG